MDLSEADSNKWSKLIAHITKGNPSDQLSANTSRELRDGNLWRPIKQQQRRFSAEEELDVVTDYADGGTVYSLAKKYGCHRTTISRILTSHDIQLANAPTDPATVDEIVRLYESGLSMDVTGREVGVSAKTVFNYLRARRVPTRPTARPEKQEGRL